LNDLSEIKRVSKSDLKHFLTQDHTSFSVLSVSTKHIESTNRISVTLSKNSACSFYLGQKKTTPGQFQPGQPDKLPDDCLKDAQNCTYFQFFNSKEKSILDSLKTLGERIKNRPKLSERKKVIVQYFLLKLQYSRNS